MVTIANGFARRGYRVDLVLACAEGPYLKDAVPSVRVVDLGAGRVSRALLPLERIRIARAGFERYWRDYEWEANLLNFLHWCETIRVSEKIGVE